MGCFRDGIRDGIRDWIRDWIRDGAGTGSGTGHCPLSGRLGHFWDALRTPAGTLSVRMVRPAAAHVAQQYHRQTPSNAFSIVDLPQFEPERLRYFVRSIQQQITLALHESGELRLTDASIQGD